MATLYVSYFGSIMEGIAAHPLGTTTITTSTTSAATSADAPAAAKVAFVFSDTAHYVTHGLGSPTASASNGFYLPANQGRELRINNQTTTGSRIAAVTLV